MHTPCISHPVSKGGGEQNKGRRSTGKSRFGSQMGFFLKQINSSLTLPCHGTQGGVLTDDLSFNIRLPGCGLGNLQVKSLCVRDIGGGKMSTQQEGENWYLNPGT